MVLRLWFKFAQILHWWYAPLFKLNLSNFFYWLLCQLTKIWQCVTTIRGLLFRQLIGTSMWFLLAVIWVLGDPINVRSTQRHFSNIHSGARGRFLWWTCQLYKAVKMIKVPFRNPERETEMERERERKSWKSAEREACRHTVRQEVMGNKHRSRLSWSVQNAIRTHISPLRMTWHGNQARPKLLSFILIALCTKS